MRIIVIGTSGSGKSTLAAELAGVLHLPRTELDALYWGPGWAPNPTAQFLADVQAAAAGERWVMDGNYTRCLPQRLQRATGLILLDLATARSLIRYFRRSWLQRNRHGALPGNRDTVKLQMLHHIAIVTPSNRQRYAELYQSIELPKLRLANTRQLQAFYAREGLEW